MVRFSYLLIAAVLLQTAAPAVWAQPASGPVRAIPVAQGLENPWAVAFLPEGRFLVTERPGRLRVVEADGRLNPPVAGLPAVAAGGQGGLLDVVLDRGFASNRTLYFCFSEPAPAGAAGNSTALARARLSEDRTRLEDVRVIFSQRPKVASSLHFGCRIVEGMKDGRPDGTLFLTLGERFQRMQDAQTLDNHHGKIVRVGKDGSVPKDNPFVGRARRAARDLELRPPQSPGRHAGPGRAAVDARARPAGRRRDQPAPAGTQLRLAGHHLWRAVRRGADRRRHHRQGREWNSRCTTGRRRSRPSGMAFLTSDRYGSAWKGSLFVGSLKFQFLNRVELAGAKVVREERLLGDLGERIRDVRQGPDGYLYVLTDNPKGRLMRLVPP
jgi:glucose/arabinose dehydrogenase